MKLSARWVGAPRAVVDEATRRPAVGPRRASEQGWRELLDSPFNVADQAAVMQAGCIVEQGTSEAVVQWPQHGYTRTLVAAMPRLAAVAWRQLHRSCCIGPTTQ